MTEAVMKVEKKMFNANLLGKGQLVTVYRMNGEVNDGVLLDVNENYLRMAIAVDNSTEPYALDLLAEEVNDITIYPRKRENDGS